MKRVDQIVAKVFLYGLPIAVILAVFASFINPNNLSSYSSLVRSLYNFSGLIFGLWMAFSLYLSGRLVFSTSFRNKLLSRLALVKERDERELALTGTATKTTFLTTLAILILLLCLSVFQVSIYQVPEDKAVNGKRGTISLGFGFSLTDEVKSENQAKPKEATKTFINYAGIPISKTAIILFLIVWQIGIYNLTMRRSLGVESKNRDSP